MLRLGLLRALTSRAQTPILPMLCFESWSLPMLVAVEPLNLRGFREADRADRGPIDDKGPSLFGSDLGTLDANTG